MPEELDHKSTLPDYPVIELNWLKENDVNHEMETWSNPFDDVYFTLNIMFDTEEQKAEYCINFE